MYIKLDVAQNTRHYILTDLLGLWFDVNFLKFLWLVQLVNWELTLVEVGSECSCDTLEAEEIISIGWNLNLVDLNLGHVNIVSILVKSLHVHLDTIAVFHFQTIFKAKVLKLIIGYSTKSKQFEEL